MIVEWCDTLVDGNGNEHRAGEFAGWGFYWKHGAIHIGQCSEQIARKAAAIGHIGEQADMPLVELLTRAGGRRIIQMPYGEDLPRIC